MQKLLCSKARIFTVVITVLIVCSYVMRWYVFRIPWRSNLFFAGVSGTVMTLSWIFFSKIHRFFDTFFPYERGIIARMIPQVLLTFIFVLVISQLSIKWAINIFPTNGIIAQQYTDLAKMAGYFAQFLVVVLINVLHLSDYLFHKWRENATRAIHLEKEKAQVQFDNLKNQLNPHFLFNSLTSLDSLIQENPELARQFLQQLSKVFRYVLQHKDKGLVPLYTELDFIKNYVFLLHTRFENHLTIDFHIPEESLDKKIAPVTLQILVENALKHNIISQERPLHIHICADDTFLKVENNFQPKKQVETSNRQGLQNLKTLYSFLIDTPFKTIEHNGKFVAYVPLISQ